MGLLEIIALLYSEPKRLFKHSGFRRKFHILVLLLKFQGIYAFPVLS